MKISMIVAMDEQRGIGKDNQLLWHLPEDFKHFKKTTINSTVVMGRKTFDSIGKPLPNRTNVVLSKSSRGISGCYVVDSIDGVLNAFWVEEQIYIIGGQTIYEQFMPYADELIVTHVKGIHEADSFFPEIDENLWDGIKMDESRDFEIKIYKRNNISK